MQFYRQPVPLTPAPIAARRKQGVSSETIAPSSANLRQQGVDGSLFILACPLVAAAHSAHRTRAARDGLPTPITPPANPTPAFAGRWSLLHKPRGRFSLPPCTAHSLLARQKRMGGAFHAAKRRTSSASLPTSRGDAPQIPCPNGAEKNAPDRCGRGRCIVRLQ